MRDYRRENVPRARELRKNMTPWERRLWYDFLRGYPVRFQRQKPIGSYIVDFYCAKAGLVVELDGGGHYEETQEVKDHLRTAWLENEGLRVLRFSNLDVDQNFSGVCQVIEREVRGSLPQSPAATAPSSEGALGKNETSSGFARASL